MPKDIRDARSMQEELEIWLQALHHLEDECIKAKSMRAEVGVIDDFFQEGIPASKDKLIEKWGPERSAVVRERSEFATIGSVARKHEFGFVTHNGSEVPARSFIRSNARGYKHAAKTFYGVLTDQIEARDIFGINVEVAYIEAAMEMRKMMKTVVRSANYGKWPSLKDPDRDGRTPGRDDPLMDTGELHDAIAARVVMGTSDSKPILEIRI